MKFFISESREGFCIKSAPDRRHPNGVFVEGFFADRADAEACLRLYEEAA